MIRDVSARRNFTSHPHDYYKIDVILCPLIYTRGARHRKYCLQVDKNCSKLFHISIFNMFFKNHVLQQPVI